MDENPNPNRDNLFTKDELEVADILLELPILMSKSNFTPFVPTWGNTNKRSAIDSSPPPPPPPPPSLPFPSPPGSARSLVDPPCNNGSGTPMKIGQEENPSPETMLSVGEQTSNIEGSSSLLDMNEEPKESTPDSVRKYFRKQSKKKMMEEENPSPKTLVSVGEQTPNIESLINLSIVENEAEGSNGRMFSDGIPNSEGKYHGKKPKKKTKEELEQVILENTKSIAVLKKEIKKVQLYLRKLQFYNMKLMARQQELSINKLSSANRDRMD